MKFAGATYLVYLGIRKLLERPAIDETEPRQAPLRAVFARGAIVNVLNPKTALFFLAFLPQFVDTDRGAVWSQVVTLGLVFVALGLVSDSAYAIAGDAAGSLLRRRATAMRRISGTIYVGLGAVAAFAAVESGAITPAAGLGPAAHNLGRSSNPSRAAPRSRARRRA